MIAHPPATRQPECASQTGEGAAAGKEDCGEDGNREERLVVEPPEKRDRVDLHVQPLRDSHRYEDLRAVGDETLHHARRGVKNRRHAHRASAELRGALFRDRPGDHYRDGEPEGSELIDTVGLIQ